MVRPGKAPTGDEDPDRPERRGRLTPEQITDQIHWLAKNGDGADRRWAINKLEPGDVSIAVAPPLNDDEFSLRLSRLMKGAGLNLSKIAFSRVFPQATPTGWTAIKRNKSKMVYAPETVVEFYAMFPDHPKDPKSGLPPGYPVDQDRFNKRKWIAHLAIQLDKARQKGTDVPETSEPQETA
jgi:hypothetical protein